MSRLVLLQIAFFSTCVIAQTVQSPRSQFKEGVSAYARGNCTKAIQLLTPVAADQLLDNANDLERSHQLLAFCYFQAGKKDLVERELRSLLLLNPEAQLDPFETPAPLLETFTQIKAEISTKSQALKKAKEQSQQSSKKDLSMLGAFVPFGFGQLQYGATLKAALIGSSEALLLGMNIGSFWWKRAYAVAPYPNGVSGEQAKTWYQTAQIVQFSSLAVLLAVYIYGVFDSFYNRLPSDTPPIAISDPVSLQFVRSIELATNGGVQDGIDRSKMAAF